MDFGYDLERFKEKPEDIFLCPICTLVARFPMECPTCGALFCTTCIQQWNAKKKYLKIEIIIIQKIIQFFLTKNINYQHSFNFFISEKLKLLNQ